VDVFLLGAGKPASGKRPAALKTIALNTKALDWQLHSFEVVSNAQIHFLGGYHVGEIIESYPHLGYTVIPDWEDRTILHTLLSAPFSNSAAIVAYADTVFRKEVITSLCKPHADIVFGVDRSWKQRYQSRSATDLEAAETVNLCEHGSEGIAEFTGLILFSPQAVEYLRSLDGASVGTSLPDLLRHLKARGFSTQSVDADSHWAEFNSPADIAHFILGTKAETLARLEPLVQHSHIGKQVTFSSTQWLTSAESVFLEIEQTFQGATLIVRSSAKGEDNWGFSNAGGFDSYLNVDGKNRSEVAHAIDSVISSYGDAYESRLEQVLIQRFIQDVDISGVVFTCGLETGSPYYRINFDDKSKSTESVTAGTHLDLRTVLINRQNVHHLESVEPKLLSTLKAVKELESLLCFDKLDIEFAIDQHGQVHIFQVRPITIDHSQYEVGDHAVSESITDSIRRFRSLQQMSPFIYGRRAYFGNMPDWNPAEIIGTRPKPLAFSLYRNLITDHVWALQRAEFGYRDVRPNPLIVSYCGQPYVDIRASFNSFIPASLSEDLAQKLADAYLDILAENPQYHDKIEFDVAFTVWTPAYTRNARQILSTHGISEDEINLLGTALKSITRQAINRLHHDVESINTLIDRRQLIVNSDLDPLDTAFALLDDCRRYGTLAFSHAARAGFVATSLLNGMVKTGILSEDRRLAFMRSIKTVAGEFEDDKYAVERGHRSREQLIQRYGHLRPGTYDIVSQAYWEDPDRYLATSALSRQDDHAPFTFSRTERSRLTEMLTEMGSEASVNQFFAYLVDAIQLRESVKFDFTRNLSLALDACIQMGLKYDLSRDQVAFLEFSDLEQLKVNRINIDAVKKQIQHRQQTYSVTQLIELPHMIMQECDFYSFERHVSMPNFVTTDRIITDVISIDTMEAGILEGKIVLIPQADPGYDWLFGHGIGGLVTKYGGANSHMAIRAAEMGLPAAIGVGEKLYETISNMRSLELDCGNHVIREVE
jgi:choline kinase